MYFHQGAVRKGSGRTVPGSDGTSGTAKYSLTCASLGAATSEALLRFFLPH